MNPSSFTGGTSVKVYEIYQEMRGGQPTSVARNFANTGKDKQRHLRLCGQMAQIVCKYCQMEVEYRVQKRNPCTEPEHGRHTSGRHRVRFGQF